MHWSVRPKFRSSVPSDPTSITVRIGRKKGLGWVGTPVTTEFTLTRGRDSPVPSRPGILT